MKLVYCAKAAVIDAEGNVLVLRRSSTHPYQAFKPDLPGGVVESGESLEVGVLREVQEETALVITNELLELVYAATEVTHTGDSITRTLYVIHLKEAKPDIQISWEHDQYVWLPMESLSVNFEGFYKTAMDYVIEHAIW